MRPSSMEPIPKVGIPLFMLRPERMPDVAVLAEELGFESVWLPEHLIFPVGIESRYPYSTDGAAPIDPSTPLLDPLVLLTFVAARTSRIRIGTNVYVLPLRHPIQTARMAMTLDLVSGGRLSLGIGAGWLAEEFQAVGVDFASRAGRTRECIRVMRALWTEETPEFHGKHFDFAPVKFEPKPAQKPHPPILVGGETDAALRRAAELGDGWYGVRHTPDSAAQRVAQLRELLTKAGREPEGFEITVSVSGIGLSRADLEAYARAGVDRIVALPWSRGREAEERLRALAQVCFA